MGALVSALSAILLMSGIEPAAPAPKEQAWIQAEPAGGGQSFTGFFRTDRAFVGRYEIAAERAGPAGRSTSRQSGTFRAEPGTPVKLSQSMLAPLSAADSWSVVLTVYEGEREVGRDRLEGPSRP